ncbi:hypothetical protein POM88_008988 [Heracleum sosnowskyi]|uniref:Uncharacterized protein n=1 Tax=Heracleum sosnowskyi TaxID=360622 RepID=A0AAD8J790_9APIA|nr:hypothetical protein POM88_008988 [Heracleum sosnowskyi]
MATTAFIASELEFVPNNYSAPVANENAPEAFHLIQRFLLNSDIGTALTAPSKLSATQIRTFWQTGAYDNGGESGSPSIIFQYEDNDYAVTPTTVRDALGLEDFNAFTISVGDSELVRMMNEIGYSGPLTKIGQLKRPFLRKEWSFFFSIALLGLLERSALIGMRFPRIVYRSGILFSMAVNLMLLD